MTNIDNNKVLSIKFWTIANVVLSITQFSMQSQERTDVESMHLRYFYEIISTFPPPPYDFCNLLGRSLLLPLSPLLPPFSFFPFPSFNLFSSFLPCGRHQASFKGGGLPVKMSPLFNSKLCLYQCIILFSWKSRPTEFNNEKKERE